MAVALAMVGAVIGFIFGLLVCDLGKANDSFYDQELNNLKMEQMYQHKEFHNLQEQERLQSPSYRNQPC